MARRGTYGQLPRSAPSLTSTIIAIAREMQQQRDANLMDAWKNGGSFEGKPATDGLILAYWRNRLKGVSKDDPLYDTYSNTLLQTDYAIQESKMSTWYAQSAGDATADTKMAAFYTGWAKKIPKDSEFYRVLQRDAAQFLRAAKAKSGGGGGGGRGSSAGAKKALEDAYQTGQAETSKNYEALGQYLTDTLRNAAKAHALIGLDDNADLSNFDPSDPAALMQLIDDVNTNPGHTVFHDPATGRAITGREILAQIKTLDPNFTGSLTTNYYGNSLRQQLTGQQIRLDRARATEHKADANNIVKWQAYTTEIGREANIWPIEEHYQLIRGQFLQTWLDPNATGGSKLAAWKVYSAGLSAMANDPKHPPDDNTKARLMAEVDGDGAIDSMAENTFGLGTKDHTTTGAQLTGDIAETHIDLAYFQQQQDAVGSGQAFWAYGQTDSSGVFHPGAGTEIGAASMTDIQQASPLGSILTYVTQGNGAPPIPVFVAGKPITARVLTPGGEPVASTDPNARQVGVGYDLMVDGKAIRLYSYVGPDGQQLFTRDAPWGDSVQEHDAPDGVELTVTLPTDPTEENVAGNPSFMVDKAFNKDGSVSNVDISVDPTRLVLTQTDPARALAGPDPFTDSVSPTIALWMGSADDRRVLNELSKDPNFTNLVDNDLRRAAHMTQDANGQWFGGNPEIYNNGARQAQISTRVVDPRSEGLGPLYGDFERYSTRGTFGIAGPTPLPAPVRVTGYDTGIAGPDVKSTVGGVSATGKVLSADPLRTDISSGVRGTARGKAGPPVVTSSGIQQQSYNGILPADAARGSDFHQLASVFQPGTNLIRQAEPKGAGASQTLLQTRGIITVPKLPIPQATAPAVVPMAPPPIQTPIPVVEPTPEAAPLPAPLPIRSSTATGGSPPGLNSGDYGGYRTPPMTPAPRKKQPVTVPGRAAQRPY